MNSWSNQEFYSTIERDAQEAEEREFDLQVEKESASILDIL
jgi:hypothetical protein